MSDADRGATGDHGSASRGGGPGRALLWVGLGIVLALVGAAILTPTGIYEVETIVPLLAVIVVGTVVTVLAGARGRRNEADRRLLASLEEQDRAAANGTGHDDRNG